MKSLFKACCLCVFIFFNVAFGQTDSSTTNTQYSVDSNRSFQTDPAKNFYTVKFKIDAPIIAGSVGLHILGYKLINDKKDLNNEAIF